MTRGPDLIIAAVLPLLQLALIPAGHLLIRRPARHPARPYSAGRVPAPSSLRGLTRADFVLAA